MTIVDSKPSIRYGAVALLMLIQAYGLNSMVGQAWRSGFAQFVWNWLHDPKAVLPGSSRPVVKRYFGIPVVDESLIMAHMGFTNVIDGSTPELSLFALHFGGQMVPILVVMMIEGLRVGNRGSILRVSLVWCHLMQALGYATMTPLYGAISLLTSSATTRSAEAIRIRSREPLNLRVLILAFALGYILPTILFIYPFPSNILRQWLGSIWQLFPHILFHTWYLLTAAAGTSSGTRTKFTESGGRRQDLQAISKVYRASFRVAAATQLFVYGVLFSVKLFPGLFPDSITTSLTFAQVFTGGSFYAAKPTTDVPMAMLHFFHLDQYVGSAAGVVWVVAAYLLSGSPKESKSWGQLAGLAWDICRWSIIAGPAGAMVMILQRRDQEVLAR